MNGDGSSDIRITSDPQQAWQLLHDLAYDEDLYKTLSRRDQIAEALGGYGVHLSDDVIPPEPVLPPVEEIREALKKLEDDIAADAVLPFVGFRPPFCPPDFGPWHGVTFGYVFTVLASRAKPPGGAAS